MDDYRPWLPMFVYGGDQEQDRQGAMVLIGDVENEETGFVVRWLVERVERAR